MMKGKPKGFPELSLQLLPGGLAGWPAHGISSYPRTVSIGLRIPLARLVLDAGVHRTNGGALGLVEVALALRALAGIDDVEVRTLADRRVGANRLASSAADAILSDLEGHADFLL